MTSTRTGTVPTGRFLGDAEQVPAGQRWNVHPGLSGSRAAHPGCASARESTIVRRWR